MKADSVRDTISRGLDAGLFAYIGTSASGQYEPRIDHAKLTYQYQGRNFRLTDVHGKVVTGVLA